MSDLYEATIPFALHSVTTPGIDLYLNLSRKGPTRTTASAISERTFASAPVTASLAAPASYFGIKSAVDRLITAALMVVALPLMLIVSLAILLLEGRPIFYRQKRVGKNGRTFQIWKFRTMCRDAESTTGAVWSSAIDPRVTPIGRWLRCSHIDELPQFFNVLMGDMNLIGPRPERPEFIETLIEEMPFYAQRHNVRPGITGLAQLHLGYDQSVADVRKKVLLDLDYIKSASAYSDFKLLVGTIPYILNQLWSKWRLDRDLARQAAETPGNSKSLAAFVPRIYQADLGETADFDLPQVPARSAVPAAHSSFV